MKTKVIVAVLTFASFVYMVLITTRGLNLINEGGLGNIVFGIAVIAIPVLAGALIVREIQFGVGVQRMGRTLVERDGVPFDTLPRDEMGRIDKAAADIEWQRRKALVEQAPNDWQAWFLLAVAYDNAKDRKRARATMRRALTLFKAA